MKQMKESFVEYESLTLTSNPSLGNFSKNLLAFLRFSKNLLSFLRYR